MSAKTMCSPILKTRGRDVVKVSRTEMLKRIDLNKGKFFTITFVKLDKTERTINCNRKLNLSDQAKENSKKGMLEVYSIQDKGYRIIDTRTISMVNIDNQLLKVNKTYPKKV